MSEPDEERYLRSFPEELSEMGSADLARLVYYMPGYNLEYSGVVGDAPELEPLTDEQVCRNTLIMREILLRLLRNSDIRGGIEFSSSNDFLKDEGEPS